MKSKKDKNLDLISSLQQKKASEEEKEVHKIPFLYFLNFIQDKEEENNWADIYDEDEDDEEEKQAKKDSVVETKKETKRKEKGLKALLNDNYGNANKKYRI